MDTGVLVCWPPTGLGVGIIISITLIIPTGILAAGDEVFTTYDLASRGKDTSGLNQCYGTYDETAEKGWGPAYQYNCIHSGTIATSGDLATVWYSYVLASAGTIISENTTSSNPANNTTTASESVCPKGWTLPTKIQIDSQRNIASFSPVYGGIYGSGATYYESNRGAWWGSEARIGATRYYLNYTSNLATYNGLGRYVGLYIRCVQAS